MMEKSGLKISVVLSNHVMHACEDAWKPKVLNLLITLKSMQAVLITNLDYLHQPSLIFLHCIPFRTWRRLRARRVEPRALGINLCEAQD
jgi:hypothetical protein